MSCQRKGQVGFLCQTWAPWAEETFRYFTMLALMLVSTMSTAHGSKCHFYLAALRANLPHTNAIC